MKERGYNMPPAVISAIATVAAAGAGIAGTVASAKAADKYSKRLDEAERSNRALGDTISAGSNNYALNSPSLGSNTLGSNKMKSLIGDPGDPLQPSIIKSGPKRGPLSGSTNFGV